MNQYRQQATGNISAMIVFGAKVYLSQRNPYFLNCVNRGMTIFAIENLKADPLSLFTPLTESEKFANRRIVQETESQEIIDGQTKTVIQVLLSDS